MSRGRAFTSKRLHTFHLGQKSTAHHLCAMHRRYHVHVEPLRCPLTKALQIHALNPSVNEGFYYHGTTSETAAKIIPFGFDETFSRGIYRDMTNILPNAASLKSDLDSSIASITSARAPLKIIRTRSGNIFCYDHNTVVSHLSATSASPTTASRVILGMESRSKI